MVTEEQKSLIMDKMNEAAFEAGFELHDLRTKYPEAAEAIGKWAAKYKNSAGYKRLAKLIAGLA